MTVSKRGSKFQAYVTQGGERFRRTFDTKVDALIWEEEMRDALQLGKPLPLAPSKNDTSWTLDAAADRTYELYWKDARAEHKAVANINKAMTYFGKHIKVQDITTEKIDDYIIHLKKEQKSNATINRHLAAVSKVLTVSSDYKKIVARPKINRLQETKWRLRWLSVEEVNLLLHTAKQVGYEDLFDAIVVSVDTGVRANELQQLTRSHIRDGRLQVDGKGHDWRSVPLTQRASEILARRGQQSIAAGSNSGYLFPRGEWCRSPWERVRGLSGLDKIISKPNAKRKEYEVVWHTLRHTFGSRLAQNGVSLAFIQKLMGHKNIKTTLKYAKLFDGNLDEAISTLEQ